MTASNLRSSRHSQTTPDATFPFANAISAAWLSVEIQFILLRPQDHQSNGISGDVHVHPVLSQCTQH